MAIKKQQITRYLLIVIALLAVTAVGFRLYQIQKEKHDFAKAEQSIDALAQKIEQTIGKPDETKKEKSCGRANLKNDVGPLTCSISRSLLYKSRSLETANQFLADSSVINNSPLRVGSGSTSGISFVSPRERGGSQVFYKNVDPINKLTCNIGYRYPSTIEQTVPEAGENDVLIHISCGGQTINQVYPIVD